MAGLGAKGGPIGAALAGVAVLGLAAGAVVADAFADGMATNAARSKVQAQLDIDDAAMAQIARAAGESYANNFGESIADNQNIIRDAILGGLISRDDSSRTMQEAVNGLTTANEIIEGDITETTRAASQLIKTGVVKNMDEAFDLIVKSSQRGLNVSGDLTEGVIEYSTQFRQLGLSAEEGMGIVAQAVGAGARDTDVAIDALKEFAIQSRSNSETAATAYELLGMSAEESFDKANRGGDDAKQVLADVLRAFNEMPDGVDKTTAAVGLFGTMSEDLGMALGAMNLDTSAAEFGKVEGAAQKAADRMASGPGAAIETASRQFEVASTEMKANLAMAFGPALTDVANWVTTHKPEIIGFFTGLAEAGLNTGIAMASFAADTLRVLANLTDGTAMALGGMIGSMGELVSVSSKVARALGMDGVADKLEGASDAMIGFQDGLESGADSMRGMADNIDGAIPGLEDLRDGVVEAGDKAQTSAYLMQALGDSVDSVPDDKTIIIESNSPEQTEQLKALGLKVETLPDGKFKVTANTADGQAAIDEFMGKNDGKNIDMFVDLRQRQIGYWQSQGVSEQDAPSMQGPTPYLNAGGGAPAAPGTFDGGGGPFADGKLPDEALLRPAGGRGLVQWAEEGAGPWEAFIPGAESKRPRAVGILKDVADRFGYGLVQMADGGIVSPKDLDSFSRGIEGANYTWGGWNGTWDTDCSGAASRGVNYATTGDPDAPGRFATGNQKEALTARGLQPGWMDGALNVGWLNGGPGGGHTTYTQPNGVSVEMGGARGDGQYGGQAKSARSFPNIMHLPMQGDPDPGSFDTGTVGSMNGGTTSVGVSAGGSGRSTRTGTLSTSSGPVDVRVVNFSDLGGAAPDGRTPKAVGSLKVFANGGIEAQNPEIATTGGNVRVWAEPQAGPWEAYIPGDPAKRARAVDIWRETGKRLNITEFADGGFGGYNEPKARDYMRPTNLMEAASLASGLGFTAASGIGGFLSMAQSGQVDLSQLMPQFDTGSNDIPGLTEGFSQLATRLEEILTTLQKGGLVTADVNVDTNNGSVALNLLSTGLA